MEEKERYIIDHFGEDIFDTKIEDYPSNQMICDTLNQQDKRIKELEGKILIQLNNNADNVNFMENQRRENQQLKQKLAITEKALELACEPRDDWGGEKYSGTKYNNYYDYFMVEAKEML